MIEQFDHERVDLALGAGDGVDARLHVARGAAAGWDRIDESHHLAARARLRHPLLPGLEPGGISLERGGQLADVEAARIKARRDRPTAFEHAAHPAVDADHDDAAVTGAVAIVDRRDVGGARALRHQGTDGGRSPAGPRTASSP